MKDGVIDITDLVQNMTDTSIKIEIELAMTAIGSIPVAGPILLWPVINIFTRAAVTAVITKLMTGARQQAFFLTTAIRKAGQAHDYVDAKSKLKALPPSATDAEYLKAEQDEIHFFNNFVCFTN